MIAVSLIVLFVFSGVFAVATIVDSWREHGPAAMTIWRRLAQIEACREIRVTTRRIEVRPGTTALRPGLPFSDAFRSGDVLKAGTVSKSIDVRSMAARRYRTGALPVAA